jgi:hypothetical protein
MHMFSHNTVVIWTVTQSTARHPPSPGSIQYMCCDALLRNYLDILPSYSISKIFYLSISYISEDISEEELK